MEHIARLAVALTLVALAQISPSARELKLEQRGRVPELVRFA